MNERHGMVLTGVGVLAPTGRSKRDFFRFLCEPARVDAPARPAPGQLLKHLKIAESKLKIARYMDPTSKNAIVALGAAMTDAGLEEREIARAPHSYGIVFGAHRGARETRNALYESFAAKQGRMLSGTIFSHCGYNIAGAMAAVAYGIKGPNVTLAGRGDVGLSLLRTARQLLERPRAHTVFVGFTECDSSLAPNDGVFRELAYVVCLERKDRATERNAAALTEVSLLDDRNEDSVGESDTRVGWPCHGTSREDGAEPLPLSLPGLKAVGVRYASLIKIGLLAHARFVKATFSEVAFTAAVGRIRSENRVDHAEEGVLVS